MSEMRSIISVLDVLKPEELIILASLIGIVSTKDLDSVEKRVVGDMLFVAASAILAMAAFEDLLTEAKAPSPDMQTNINKLSTEQAKMVKQFEELQRQVQEILLKLEKG